MIKTVTLVLHHVRMRVLMTQKTCKTSTWSWWGPIFWLHVLMSQLKIIINWLILLRSKLSSCLILSKTPLWGAETLQQKQFNQRKHCKTYHRFPPWNEKCVPFGQFQHLCKICDQGKYLEGKSIKSNNHWIYSENLWTMRWN